MNKKKYILNKKIIQHVNTYDHNSIDNIHIYFLIYLNQNNKEFVMKELLSLDNTVKSYTKSHGLFYSKYCFLGCNGSLPLDLIDFVMKNDYINIFIDFFSIFSSRILQLRSKYLLQYLPYQNGYIYNFIDNFLGFNYKYIFEKVNNKFIVNKNKTLIQLKNVLSEYTLCDVKIEKYSIAIINHNLKQDWFFNKLILGKNNYMFVPKLYIFCNSYEKCICLLNDYNISTLIKHFFPIWKIKFILKKNKILLKDYFLSSKVLFS